MTRFYYHGLGDFYPEVSLDIVLEIIKSGSLKTRDEVRNIGGGYAHVCLYKKNEDYDYNELNTMLKSARSGWIEHCITYHL